MSDKHRSLLAILAFFFGIFGAHLFYAGKMGTAFLMLFTVVGLASGLSLIF